MKVLYVVRDLNGKGGIQSFAKTSRDALQSSTKCNIKLDNWRSPLSIMQEITLRLAPSVVSKYLYPIWFDKKVEDDLNKYDLIHFWHIKSAMSMSGSLKKPYVLTCHGSEVMRAIVPDYQYVNFLRALNKAAIITTPSQFTKNYICSHYDISPNKVRVVNPSIDTKKFKLSTKVRSDVKDFQLGTLSRLVKRKNIINIINALSLLDAKGLRFTYNLAGSGSYLQKRLILRKLQKVNFRWNYLGEISERVKIDQFYPILDAFILPPLYIEGDVEGFGIVFLEANASGVPVIASDTGGVSDAVQYNASGVFADPMKPQDIAEKISTVLDSGNNWTRTTREWAQNFTTEKLASSLHELYESLIN